MSKYILIIFGTVSLNMFSTGLAAAWRPANADSCEVQLLAAERWNKEAYQLAQLARFSEAEQLAGRALKTRERCLGTDHLLVAETLHVIGKVCKSLQQYARGVSLELRALRIREKYLDPNDPEIARSLNLLAMLYQSVGQNIRATQLLERALRSFESQGNTSHHTYATLLNNAGQVALENKQYAAAQQQFDKALAIWSAVYGPQDYRVGVAIENLAMLHAQTGRLALALQEYDQAHDIWRKSLGPSHPFLANGLYNIALTYAARGQYSDAERSLHESLKSQLVMLGPQHPEVAKTRHALALLYVRMNRMSEACEQAQQAMDVYDRFLQDQGIALSEEQYSVFVDSLQDQEDALYSALSPYLSSSRVAALLLALTLHRKGRTLDEAANFSMAVYRELSPKHRAQYEQLRSLRNQFAGLSLAGPGVHDSHPNFRRSLDELAATANRLEEELVQSSALLRQRRSTPQGTQILARVRAALPPGAALIEYVAYESQPAPWETRPANPTHHYLAFGLTADRDIITVDLCDAKALEEAVNRYCATLRVPGTPPTQYLTMARELQRQLTAPLLRKLSGVHWLIFSPDGILNNLPFSALHDGTTYLEDRYLVSYLTSGRDLLRHAPATSLSGIQVFADPTFHAQGVPSEPLAVGIDSGRGLIRMQFGQVTSLPGTRKEALAIQQIFPDAQLFLGTEATESALLGVTAPMILHIATHGLFLEDGPDVADTRTAHSHFAESSTPAPSHPLLRSALLLSDSGSGATATAGNTKAHLDGIATALELAGMNLWGTQLVVLSACSSGRGQVKIGQGVYGLRRAIMTAGAWSLVTSLWKVDDDVTQQLMRSFYAWLKAGTGRAEALRQAARETRNSHPHPYYWASFILIGEGRAIALNRETIRGAGPRVAPALRP